MSNWTIYNQELAELSITASLFIEQKIHELINTKSTVLYYQWKYVIKDKLKSVTFTLSFLYLCYKLLVLHSNIITKNSSTY